ncbi:hypothetical protein [Streptomyces monashensis]|uniref:hypothetical protein n=1 Tax=Streptomyces monashensis TaxID=1678012 RepID=UPI0011604BF2|nr:hypothetical protein [Streptomyces monashensis]
MSSTRGTIDADMFLASSRRWMHEAMRHAAAEPPAYDLAVHHAQVAAEHLLKGFLFSVEPAIIADNTTMLLHLTGAIHQRTQHAAERRLENGASISARDALELAREFTKRLDRVSNQRWAAALSARNGVAHLGIVDASMAESNIVTCFDVVDALLKELGESHEAYWGTWAGVRESLGKAHLDDVTRRMRVRLAKARAYIAEKYGELNSSIPPGPILWSYRGMFGPGRSGFEVPCPVEGHSGMLVGYSTARDERGVNIFVAHSFFCQVCGLKADVDEFEPLGIPESLDIGEKGPVAPPVDRDPIEWQDYLASERESEKITLQQEIAEGRWCGFPGIECPCDRGEPRPTLCHQYQ